MPCLLWTTGLSPFVVVLVLAGIASVNPVEAQGSPEKRIALVVGNAAYKAGALPTPANDAGLIAQTLQAAGFDVIGARDLDQNALRDAMRDFLTKANASGPNTVVFVYLAGCGVQYQGDNYFVPVDAQIANATDVPVEALRITDLTRSLAVINNRGSIVVLDAARANPFVQSNQPLAGGLALVDPDANQLIAFNAAPGTVAPQEPGPYGSYAHALAEMIRIGGLPIDVVFDRTRLRVSDLTKGAQISWNASKFKNAFTFFDRVPNPPSDQVSSYDNDANRTKPISDFDERDAYFAALDRDTMRGYEDFLAAYPNDTMARRVRAIIAARREAITWRETSNADTPEAYWSYLRRYPRGPHVWDARRRLEHFEAALEPPPSFSVIEYDVPPPPPPEIVYVDRPLLYFDDADFGYAPPPPVVFLSPPPPDFVTLAPPRPPVDLYVLPAPVFVPVPEWVEPPRNVAPPENNIIFNNIHNTVVNNTVVNETEAAPAAPGLTTGEKLAGAAVIAGSGAAALHVALPPSVQKKITVLQKKVPVAAEKPTPAAGLAPAPVLSVQPQTQQPQTPTDNAATHTLPGTNDQPLPPAYKLANKPEAAPVEKTQPPKAEPNTSHALRTVVQPPLQSTDPNAHAIPGSKGQPQLPEANAPAVKDQSQIAKTPARTATPDAKPKGGVAASKLDAHSLPTKPAAPAIIDRTPAKPSIPNNSEPQLGGQRQDVPPSSGGVAPRPSLPREPHVAAPAQAPVPKPPAEPKLKVEPKIQAEPKPQAEPEPQPKPAIVEQQAKRPPATEKKKCGAPDQPACP
ncbi:peptidase C14 caspase catalytic subunit p20 (plasmid) [Rhizobium leguminosarum]|uniref:Peptidase C14 caspase catalytic subunit p20 n=1 Tax=Rhizobium leguminosarum TaxID=384 RepID=A0A4Q8XNI8_RHILE|nr:caspase domain-containing protein [Rhizobium leguminosarum]TAV41631.1 peptidase C14 caspase catalytic subunit p20 [Rhizobium leguminosarum]TAX22853.1 peptidase C14 caspase catalytic subunit p20 [Rhizobium leguminosarum]TAX45687.1 peptidase C14 caspase catalytic subunit p20 [Rhizobium leguminosarum]TAX46595.1 peptidase C14 caspase catalytic subunit p20 [Rhizobium leguminosarum]TAX64082.1 peptidase C14 caspase catalytic subunit p20 [Rhizobium leguminosarum]